MSLSRRQGSYITERRDGRSLVYRLALSSGLRFNEVRLLQRRDFEFGEDPTVTVRAETAKNDEEDTLPLQPELAQDIWEYFDNSPAMPHARCFALWQDAGAEMLKEDLDAAGIPYETAKGFADFHALRHTFCTRLGRNKDVSFVVAQRLMRHKDPKTTMIYCHPDDRDKAKAIATLRIIRPEPTEQRKTGTDDTPVESTGYSTGNKTKNYHETR